MAVLSVFLGFFYFTEKQRASRITERHYWIAAEKVQWNYAPSGKNMIMPKEGLGVWGKDLVYKKYRYI